MNAISEAFNLVPQPFWTIALSVLTSSGVTWTLKEVISTRLKSAISFEYSQKLQEHKLRMDSQLASQKTQFDADLQAVKFAHEISQTRTSLFFDHQREAFSKLSSEMAFNLFQWEQIHAEVASTRREFVKGFVRDIEKLMSDHQLFLDPECQSALELLVEIYHTYAVRTEDGREESMNEYETAKYLRTRIIALFQKKIGVPYDLTAPREIAILGIVFHMN